METARHLALYVLRSTVGCFFDKKSIGALKDMCRVPVVDSQPKNAEK